MQNATHLIKLAVQQQGSLTKVSPSPSHSALQSTSLALWLVGIALLTRLWTSMQFKGFFIYNIVSKSKHQVFNNSGLVRRELGFIGPAGALTAMV